MAKKIYKYNLEITDEQIIELPRYCTPLLAQFQNGDLVMWAMVDVDEKPVKAHVRIFGTGNPIPDGFYIGSEHNLYLGTVQQMQGFFVWHVFIFGTFTTNN